jgi:hypothetical protein
MGHVADARVDDLAMEVADTRFHRALDRVLATQRLVRWEWVLAVAAVFVLGRSNVLFFRLRLAGLFNGRGGTIWQNDLVVQLVFGVTMAAVVAAAIWRSRAVALLRQPALIAFVVIAWLSMMWSVEPSTTLRRSLLFIGTIAVGWYIGDRFSPSNQTTLVALVGGVSLGFNILGFAFWNRLARSTTGHIGQWSGVYVNRNLLGAVMAYGVMALLFVVWSRRGERRWPLFIPLILMLFVLLMTQSRTGPVALAGSLLVAGAVAWFRRSGSSRISPVAGAYVTFASIGTIGLVIAWYWDEILSLLGRDSSLTLRRYIWQVDRWFIEARLWLGYGFEAIWDHPRAIEQAYHAIGRYPYQAHNAYYEIWLSVGLLGLVFFVLFLGMSAWRAFLFAWTRRDVASLWPLTFIVFAVIMNFSESMFVSTEATLALTVAAAVGVTEWSRRAAP